MKNTYFIILFSFLVCLFGSCTGQEIGKEEAIITKKIRDSLALTGKHGYFTVTFIVGRLKTTAIENLPFIIDVNNIAPELVEEQIRFKMLDSLNYTIVYKKSEKDQTLLKGTFGKKMLNDKIQLMISKTKTLSKSEVLESLKMIDYVFKIYKY